MPVIKVKGPGGKIGYQWGRTGKIYTGPGARERAERQGRAIYSTGYRQLMRGRR